MCDYFIASNLTEFDLDRLNDPQSFHAAIYEYFKDKLGEDRKSIWNHLKKYNPIYQRGCPFTIRSHSIHPAKKGGTFARKGISKNTVIESLSGTLFPLSSQQVQEFERAGECINIVRSHLGQRNFYLAGPAQFVQHDCRPNAELMRAGQSCLAHVVARREIATGEEIVIDYGQNYFDSIDIAERSCGCRSCQANGNKLPFFA